MASEVSRRRFLGTAGVAVAASGATTAVQGAASDDAEPVKIIGIATSFRKGKTTATSLGVCLEAAKKASERIETELIDLAGLKIDGSVAAGIPLEPGQRDDFPQLTPKLSDPKVAGIIIGTPVYFGNMSSLCKAFLERCVAFRKEGFALSNKVAGVLAVGGSRNGGQEFTVRSVQTAMFAQEMIIVGDGRPTCHTGATIWNSKKGEVTDDEFGMATARNLGRRVAEVALLLRGQSSR